MQPVLPVQQDRALHPVLGSHLGNHVAHDLGDLAGGMLGDGDAAFWVSRDAASASTGIDILEQARWLVGIMLETSSAEWCRSATGSGRSGAAEASTTSAAVGVWGRTVPAGLIGKGLDVLSGLGDLVGISGGVVRAGGDLSGGVDLDEVGVGLDGQDAAGVVGVGRAPQHVGITGMAGAASRQPGSWWVGGAPRWVGDVGGEGDAGLGGDVDVVGDAGLGGVGDVGLCGDVGGSHQAQGSRYSGLLGQRRGARLEQAALWVAGADAGNQATGSGAAADNQVLGSGPRPTSRLCGCGAGSRCTGYWAVAAG
jgi:hypothetical protein